MSETTVNEAAAAAPAPKPKRPKAKSMIMMGEQTAAMFENARLAKEKGEPVGWSASIFPQEIAETLGLNVLYPENHAAGIAARHQADPFLQECEGELGYSNDLCAYAKVNLAYAAVLNGESEIELPDGGKMVKPDFLLLTNNICNQLTKWYENLSKQMNIPIFFIDTCYNPYDYVTETRVRYVRAQIDQLIEDEGFEAVFIGSGAGLPMFMGIPGENASGVFSANEYLTRSNLMKAFDDSYDTPIAAGKKVAVVGGGNVAMDAARTALRLGAEVHIVYRRSEAELPARAEEVHHAKEEGIIFDLLTNPKEILVDENGHVKGMKVVKMELGEPDASGRRRPVEIPGSEYDMDVDTVIMSLGTSPNPLISSTTKGLEVNKRRCIIAEEETGKTSKDGVYAGGDAVTGAATVILAMGAGKAGAKGIDEYLKNK